MKNLDIAKLAENSKLLIVSVRQDITKEIIIKNYSLSEQEQNNIYFFDKKLACEKFSIKNIYEQLGSDRILNLIGAIKLFPKKSCFVIDFGTYTTYTAVKYLEKTNSYEFNTSSYIFLGIKSLFESIRNNNPVFSGINEFNFIEYCNYLDSKNINNIQSQSLRESVYNGIIRQTSELINSLALENPDSYFILTGGWSEVLYSVLNASISFKNSGELKIEKNLYVIGGIEYLKLI